MFSDGQYTIVVSNDVARVGRWRISRAGQLSWESANNWEDLNAIASWEASLQEEELGEVDGEKHYSCNDYLQQRAIFGERWGVTTRHLGEKATADQVRRAVELLVADGWPAEYDGSEKWAISGDFQREAVTSVWKWVVDVINFEQTVLGGDKKLGDLNQSELDTLEQLAKRRLHNNTILNHVFRVYLEWLELPEDWFALLGHPTAEILKEAEEFAFEDLGLNVSFEGPQGDDVLFSASIGFENESDDKGDGER